MKSKKTEQQVFQAIRDNPFATQKEIGETLGIARATVALHIDRLHSKGMIKGRAYVLNEELGITCLGAMAVDQLVQLHDEVILDTSNLADRRQSCGGVARNVAENLTRLNVTTNLISQVGNDPDGLWLLDKTRETTINIDAISTSRDYPTANYTAVLEPNGTLYMGISDMEIFNVMGPEFIHKNWKHIAGSKLAFCDTNGSVELIETVIERAHEQGLPLYMDAVSAIKAKRLPASLEGLHGLFCNRLEAQAILDIKTDEIDVLAKALVERGANTVFLTDGKNGVWLATKDSMAHIPALPCEVADVSGAGDALIAGTLYGLYHGASDVEAVEIGIKAASITLQDVGANSVNLNIDALK